jgi:hypothetical protein
MAWYGWHGWHGVANQFLRINISKTLPLPPLNQRLLLKFPMPAAFYRVVLW